MFKNTRVRVRKSSRLCHELGPVWGRRSAEQGGDWRPFCFFNTAWCCTVLSGFFLPVCQLINSLSFSLRQRQKANQKLEHWGKNQRRKSQRGNRQRRKSQGRGMCPRKRKSRGEKGTTLTKVKPIKFLSFVCSYSYVIWYLSFLGPFLSLLLNIHIIFFSKFFFNHPHADTTGMQLHFSFY